MKLDEVLKKERERKGFSAEDVASALGVSAQEYADCESGDVPIHEWELKLANFAMQLEDGARPEERKRKPKAIVDPRR